MFFFWLEKLPFTESPMNIMQWIYDILLLTDAYLIFKIHFSNVKISDIR